MMDVAIYARVSTTQQAQEQTIDQQVSRLQAQVQEQGGQLVPERIFRDDGYSGATLARPGLDALRQAIADGLISQVLITAPDRLARNYVHQVLLLEELRASGCQVTFLERPMSADPHDQLLLQIRGAVAEYERTLITERLRRGRLAKLRAGALLPWASPPYGYQGDLLHPRDPAGLQPEPVRAAVVQTIFAWYLEDQATLSSVAKRLGQSGVPSPTGQPYWSSAMVRRIVRNPIYVGDPPALPALQRTGDTDPIPLTLPPLIGREEFTLAADKLVRNQREASRHNTTHPYLLRGRIRCGHCQLQATGATRRGGSYYRCNGTTNRSRLARGRTCPGRLIPVGQVDELVWTDLVGVLTDPVHLAQALARAQQGAWLPQTLTARQQALQRARGALARQDERLLEAYLAGVLELAEFDRKRRESAERRRAIATQQRQLDAATQQQQDLASVAASLEEFCGAIRTGLADADFAQRRALVELLVEQVVVTDEQVEIHYIMPVRQPTTVQSNGQLWKGYLGACVGPQPDMSSPLEPLPNPSKRQACRSRGRGTLHIRPESRQSQDVTPPPSQPPRPALRKKPVPRVARWKDKAPRLGP
jgi:site-specific DNA recombinase